MLWLLLLLLLQLVWWIVSVAVALFNLFPLLLSLDGGGGRGARLWIRAPGSRLWCVANAWFSVHFLCLQRNGMRLIIINLWSGHACDVLVPDVSIRIAAYAIYQIAILKEEPNKINKFIKVHERTGTRIVQESHSYQIFTE